MHTEQTLHTYIPASTAHTLQTHPTDTTHPHPQQTLQTHRQNPRDTTLHAHTQQTHTANTPPHQPTLMPNGIHTHPPLTPHTHTSPGTHTSIHSRHQTHTHTHPADIAYTPTHSHVLCHIQWSWWPCTWYDMRKLRSPHQPTPTCTRQCCALIICLMQLLNVRRRFHYF